MATQTLVWTALPNGISRADGRLNLSAFLSPRLVGDQPRTTLDQFPSFLDWPTTLATSVKAWTVLIKDGSEIDAEHVYSFDPSLWLLLFPGEMPVQGWEIDDYTHHTIVPFPARAIHHWLREQYPTVALASPISLPEIVSDYRGSLSELMSELVALWRTLLPDKQTRSEQELSRRLDTLRQDGFLEGDGFISIGTPSTPPTDTTSQFAQAMLFHYAPLLHESPPDMPTPEQLGDRIDFHRVISALTAYPELLRRLGFVVNLAVDPTAVPTSEAEQPRFLAVRPRWESAIEHTSEISPWTAYEHESNTRFLSAPNIHAGVSQALPVMRRLIDFAAHGETELLQIDVDGAALKLLSLAATLHQRPDLINLPLDAPERSGLPTLRSSGLWIAHSGRPRVIESRSAKAIDDQRQLDTGHLPAYFAEDLVRGYRVDVAEKGRPWRSLHERVGSYRLIGADGGIQQQKLDDEGFVQPGVTEPFTGSSAPSSNPALHVHESLFKWDGWSLSAPAPGKSISRDPRAPIDGVPETQPTRVTNEVIPGLNLSVDFEAVAGSLPRLRFGRQYRLRARAVDLAGNSLTLDEADEVIEELPSLALANDEFGYRRWEPILPPAVIPRVPFAAGEAAARIAIRSNFNMTVDDFIEAKKQVDQGRERHLVPPKASQLLVETYGLFDASIGTQKDYDWTYRLAKKEAGSLNDAFVYDPLLNIQTPVPEVRLIEIPTQHGITSEPNPQPQHYAVHGEEQLRLPYLPDPSARGVAIRGLPCTPAGRVSEVMPDGSIQWRQPIWHGGVHTELLREETSVVLIPFEGGVEWFDALPFRLRLVDQQEVDSKRLAFWDAGARMLNVVLPQASRATIHVSCYLNEEDRNLMGMAGWLEDRIFGIGFPVSRDAFQQRDQMYEYLDFGLNWMVTPSTSVQLVHAVQQPLLEPEILDLAFNRIAGATWVDLGGEIVAHGSSTSKLDLLASWPEPRDDPNEHAPYSGNEAPTVSAHVFDIPINLDRPSSVNEIFHYSDDKNRVRFHWNRDLEPEQVLPQPRQEFHDTKHRRVTYSTVATSRFREYFGDLRKETTPVSRSATHTVVLSIPSSHRPAPPKILYVVPTFAWSRQRDGTSVTSQRKGLGLRVYIDRGWFSSGEGEMLGVVIFRQSHPNLSLDKAPPRRRAGRATDRVWARAN